MSKTKICSARFLCDKGCKSCPANHGLDYRHLLLHQKAVLRWHFLEHFRWLVVGVPVLVGQAAEEEESAVGS